MFVWLVSSIKWVRSKNGQKSDPNVCPAGFLATNGVGVERSKVRPLMFVWLVSSLKRVRSQNGDGVKMVKKSHPNIFLAGL
jgi:hypothetical protein